MSILNRASLRRRILALAGQHRPGHRLTRVSGSSLDHYETMLLSVIIADLKAHPSMGQTFDPPSRLLTRELRDGCRAIKGRRRKKKQEEELTDYQRNCLKRRDDICGCSCRK